MNNKYLWQLSVTIRTRHARALCYESNVTIRCCVNRSNRCIIEMRMIMSLLKSIKQVRVERKHFYGIVYLTRTMLIVYIQVTIEILHEKVYWTFLITVRIVAMTIVVPCSWTTTTTKRKRMKESDRQIDEKDSEEERLEELVSSASTLSLSLFLFLRRERLQSLHPFSE
jgi:hypothetical protein